MLRRFALWSALVALGTGGCAQLSMVCPVTSYQKGLKAERQRDYAAAKRHYEASGADEALLRLGNLYNTGKLGTHDHVKAFALWREAAERGNPAGLYNVALALATGNGVKQSAAGAAEYFRRAADAGDAESAYLYGERCRVGDGVKVDPEQAVRYFRLAADAGHVKAMDRLGSCSFVGSGCPKSPEAAYRWWSRAAERGYAPAQYSLALCLHGGIGVTQDSAAALRYCRLAAAQKYPDAVELEKKLCP